MLPQWIAIGLAQALDRCRSARALELCTFLIDHWAMAFSAPPSCYKSGSTYKSLIFNKFLICSISKQTHYTPRIATGTTLLRSDINKVIHRIWGQSWASLQINDLASFFILGDLHPTPMQAPKATATSPALVQGQRLPSHPTIEVP